MKKIIFVVIWSVVFLVGLGAVWDLGTLLVIIVMQHVHPLGVDAVKLIGMSWFVVPILMGLLGSILGIAGKLPGTKRIADAPARDAEQPSLARPSGKAGFILALASLVMGPLFAVPAIILGRRVLSKLNKIDGERNARRLAISSIMIGCIALCLHIPLIVIGYRAYHCFQIQQKYTAAVKCRAESLAQLKTSNIPSEMARSIFEPFIPENSAVGIVIGITGRTGRNIFVCGQPEFDGNTLFEVGSVSKVFTGTILATMIQDGAIRESDLIGKFIPQTGTASNPALQEIQICHLATHTAGLPGLPNNISKARMTFYGLTKWGDPYHGYSKDRLYEAIRTTVPVTVPGKTVSYSNYGMGLLGQILADLEHTGYEQLLLDRVCNKLAMQRTRINLSPQLRKDLAAGHLQNGEPASNWDVGALAGAGGIKSCVNDLFIFTETYLRPTNETFAVPVRLALTPRHNVSTNTAIGLTWFRMQGKKRTIWFHNGGTGGYSSFVGLDKDAGIGLVVLANACFAGELTQASFEFMALLAKNEQNEEIARETRERQ